MLTATPIGSCRIATPLRIGRSAFGYSTNHNRVYGYSHSSSEAVQQVQFLQGEFLPLPELWPLIAADKDYEEKRSERHETSDIYIVEISSAKTLAIGGQFIQLNYLRRHFAEFFSNKRRAQTLMRLCVQGKSTAMSDFLDTTWCDSPQRRDESLILRHLRAVVCDEEMLAEHLVTMRDMLPHVLFVSHVNARREDGQRLPGRDEFIGILEAAARRTDVKFENPTHVMESFGQANAVADNSTAFAHFTDAFSLHLIGHWYDTWLRDMIDELVLANPEDNIQRIVEPLAAAIASQHDIDRQRDLIEFLESITSFWPNNFSLRAALFNLNLASENEIEAHRAFLHLALNCDLKRLDCFRGIAPHSRKLHSWLTDLMADSQLSVEKRSDLASLARSLESVA